MTGVWLLVATSCSGSRGKEGGEEESPSTFGKEEYEELSHNGHNQVESLCVRVIDCGHKKSPVVCVCYRLPDQIEPADEAFFLQLQEVLQSQALVLLEDFSHLDTRCKSCTASRRQSRRFLEYTEDKFLSQVIDSPIRGDARLDLLLISVSELINNFRIGGCLGCKNEGWWNSIS